MSEHARLYFFAGPFVYPYKNTEGLNTGTYWPDYFFLEFKPTSHESLLLQLGRPFYTALGTLPHFNEQGNYGLAAHIEEKIADFHREFPEAEIINGPPPFDYLPEHFFNYKQESCAMTDTLRSGLRKLVFNLE